MIRPAMPQTAAAVAAHYDALDPFYRELWGEHVHHGLWRSGREDAAHAVEALVEHVAARLGILPGQSVCDIGCGYGATARQLAECHGARVIGLTISPAQAERGQAAGLDIRCRDWLDNGLPDGGFDHALAIESSEHMVDKPRFFAEAYRILRPGGRLAVCAWLARTTPKPWEVRHLLEPICREGRLPSMGSADDYLRMAEVAGFHIIAFEDLSRQVRHTWLICIARLVGKLLSDPRYRAYLRDRRQQDRAFVLSLFRLALAYRTGSMRYGLLLATRAER